MTTVDWAMFDAKPFIDAANRIEKHGWWSSAIGPNGPGDLACIGLALLDAGGSTNQLCILQALSAHFDVPAEWHHIYALNDSQTAESGKNWAIHNLILVAERIVMAQREALVPA